MKKYKYMVWDRDAEGFVKVVGATKGKKKLEAFLNTLDEGEEVFQVNEKEVITRMSEKDWDKLYQK